MTKKAYDWKNGAVLEDHTRKKHAVLRRYLREYLVTRCQIPHQERFRLIIVEGFAGGGIYGDGAYGSPIIIADELAKSTKEINSRREMQGLRPIAIMCLLILNDADGAVVNLLRGNMERVLDDLRAETPHLDVITEYYSGEFQQLYPRLVNRIDAARCRNVLFNLDQCGYGAVTGQIIADAMTRWRSAEVFLTFAIESLLAFLSPGSGYNNLAFDPELEAHIRALQADSAELLTKKEWLGTAEQAVHAYFRKCAPYVSPFSINNPAGWRYWLMHFANSHRARQVYNDILHKDDAVQAHFGRAGLHMLSYDPCNEGQLYLFDANSRERAREALINEVPSLVAEFGDAMSMHEFYANAYSATPAHTDDIHEVIIANPDIEVITESGGKRRRAGTIRQSDTLKLKHQRSLFLTFPRNNTDSSS